MIENILIVEDNEEQKIYANELVRDFGVKLYHLSDFKNCQEMMPSLKLDGVLSDLYFPSGYDKNSETYQGHKSQTLSWLNSYVGELRETTPLSLLKATEFVFNQEITSDNLEEIIQKMKTAEFTVDGEVIDGLNRSVNGREKIQGYESLYESMDRGEHLLPEGIFVYELAKQKDLPCVIVTDCYHHGNEFQPFVSQVGGQYRDNLNSDGSKQWKQAFEMLKWSEKATRGEKI